MGLRKGFPLAVARRNVPGWLDVAATVERCGVLQAERAQMCAVLTLAEER